MTGSGRALEIVPARQGKAAHVKAGKERQSRTV